MSKKLVVVIAAVVLGSCGGVKEFDFMTKVLQKRCKLAYDASLKDIREKVSFGFFIGSSEGDCNEGATGEVLAEAAAAAIFTGRNFKPDEAKKCLDEVEKLTVDDFKKGVQLLYPSMSESDKAARSLLGFGDPLSPTTEMGACVPEKVFNLGMPGQACYISSFAPLKNGRQQADLDTVAGNTMQAPGQFCGTASLAFLSILF